MSAGKPGIGQRLIKYRSQGAHPWPTTGTRVVPRVPAAMTGGTERLRSRQKFDSNGASHRDFSGLVAYETTFLNIDNVGWSRKLLIPIERRQR